MPTAPSIVQGDLHVSGALTSNSMSVPSSTITNAAVAAAAKIAGGKLEHQNEYVYQQESAATAVGESRTVAVIYGKAATTLAFEAGAVVANLGNSTVTVDLLKNGVSILTAPITLNSTHAAYALVTATISSTALLDGNVLEFKITPTVGTGTLAKGVFAHLVTREDADP